MRQNSAASWPQVTVPLGLCANTRGGPGEGQQAGEWSPSVRAAKVVTSDAGGQEIQMSVSPVKSQVAAEAQFSPATAGTVLMTPWNCLLNFLWCHAGLCEPPR